MPTIQRSDSIGAATVNDNVLAGSQFEFAPYNCFIEFGLVGDANAADLAVDVYTGQDIITEAMQPSSANRTPVYPDDFSLNDVVRAGERIKVRVRNNNGAAARTLNTTLRITPA